MVAENLPTHLMPSDVGDYKDDVWCSIMKGEESQIFNKPKKPEKLMKGKSLDDC